jgi:hypothetical protein
MEREVEERSVIGIIGSHGNHGSGFGVRCGACESREVTVDQVEHGGWLWIAACRHCDHRWTRRMEPALDPALTTAAHPTARMQPARRAEVASAA